MIIQEIILLMHDNLNLRLRRTTLILILIGKHLGTYIKLRRIIMFQTENGFGFPRIV